MQGHSAMDIRKQLISINGYPCFIDMKLQLSVLLWMSIWISLDLYGYPCIDLLWILDSGLPVLNKATRVLYLVSAVLYNGVFTCNRKKTYFLGL